MNKINRIIDVNINRVSEGLRILEDISRFYYNTYKITEDIKKLRHKVRKAINDFQDELIIARDSINDLGLDISQKNNLDSKKDVKELIAANFKRVQEGLRVIEENLKISGFYKLSKEYEIFRYDSYFLEKEYFRILNKETRKKILNTDLYCITAEEYSNGRKNIEVVKEMIEAGVKIIQYREKDKKISEKYEECVAIRNLTKKAGVTFIVNDHVDIAILVKADGVHIGQDDLPARKVRELVGEDMIIGLSTHSPEQAKAAVEDEADYIGVGPIFKTYTKKDVCAPVGLEYLKFVVNNLNIPFVAIGGIKQHNVSEVVKCGAKCIAMVTEIVSAKDIKAKIEEIRKTIKESV